MNNLILKISLKVNILMINKVIEHRQNNKFLIIKLYMKMQQMREILKIFLLSLILGTLIYLIKK